MNVPLLKKKIEVNHSVTKSFSFQKNGVALAFNLRVDTKDQLKTFEELLVEALAEVRSDIEK